MKLKLAIVIYLVMIMAVGNSFGQKHIVVKGRVINEKGSPLKGASVCIIVPPCKKCLDQLVPCLKTENEGIFQLDSLIPKGVWKAIVYVEEKQPDGYKSLIYDPSFQLRNNEKYGGAEIKLSKNERIIDVKDIQPNIKFTTFTIEIPKYFITKDKSQGIYDNLTFQVKNIDGSNITKKQHVDRNYWTESGSVKLVLPRGKWILDIQDTGSLKEQNRKSFILDVTNDSVEIHQRP